MSLPMFSLLPSIYDGHDKNDCDYDSDENDSATRIFWGWGYCYLITTTKSARSDQQWRSCDI
ncbi:hypothetical protein KSS87_018801 [Heliosperma pusillum]|nr:hypothetical protein KSS87_018801 [Heliosperma pusillum]